MLCRLSAFIAGMNHSYHWHRYIR